MKIHNLTTDEVFHSLVTSPAGIDDAEAERRRAEFGPNELAEARRTPLVLRFLRQFTHFLAVLLWVGAGLSFLSGYLHPGEGMSTLGLAIVAVIIINALFTFIQEYRAERALEELGKLLPFRVTVIRGGRERQIESRDVVPGDVIVLAEGDKVPADARLIEAAALTVNNASLTGESGSLLRHPAPWQGEFLESPNIAFAGTAVVSGSGRAVAFATGMRTEFGRIAHLTSAVEPGLSPLQKEIVKATRLVAFIAGVVGLFFFVLGFVIGRSFWENFIFGVGITVALIPEGMLPTVTLALAMGSQRMARRRALIRTLTAVETLGSVTVICTDKTGTLTQNRMAVAALWHDGTETDAANLRPGEAGTLLQTAAFCNNARYVDGDYRGDPTEVALLRMARVTISSVRSERLREIPFDADRKMMTTVNVVPGGVRVFAKGALETLLPLCHAVARNGDEVPLDGPSTEKILKAYAAMMDRGLRVLAFASKTIAGRTIERQKDAQAVPAEELEHDLCLAGLIGLEDPPRPEVPAAVRTCRDAGIRVIMITGDASRTAVAIARGIGLVAGEPVIVEGPVFVKMSDRELRDVLAREEVIFSRMTPKHKMRVVSVLKDEGEVVAVTGDGVNDAPALKKADIGIAMGITGTDVAKEAADMVLLDDNFATIVNAVEEGRAVYDNIRKFITYIFASNIPEAVPYLAYILLGIPLPLTIMQILAVDLGTDMLPALALGVEKPTPGAMKRPPRRKSERLIDFALIKRAYLFLGPIEAAACMFGFFWVLSRGDWTWGAALPSHSPLYLQATTACLTAIIVTQVANVFACRSRTESVFTLGLFSNRLIFLGIAAELLLQLFIVYTPWGNAIFGTAPLPAAVWLALLPFAVLLFGAEEVRKKVAGRRGGGRGG